ncbi:hypothetical protein [Vallitalea okinawensis]|uniref:hypothetical protein n=1 Tax=Vallitalea okinawensis TaxID=2078660 RepID=UPI001A9A4380|nr:hypothetical protein [Vallitalea okinawensis]
MEEIKHNYYKGFEDEPEIQFTCSYSKDRSKVLKIWNGYFDNIMNAIQPEVSGWTSIAYYYHLHEGWYKESPWRIQDIDSAVMQFKKVDIGVLDRITQKVLNDILELLIEAQANNETVLISYY